MAKRFVPKYRIVLEREDSAHAGKNQSLEIRNAEEAGLMFCEHIGHADREIVGLVALDVNHRVIGVHVVSIGTLEGAPVHPREVFKPAILLNAAAVIVGHNHVSGFLEPSGEDIETTKRLIQAGRILGIEVLDHVIVSHGGEFLSLKQRMNSYWGT